MSFKNSISFVMVAWIYTNVEFIHIK